MPTWLIRRFGSWLWERVICCELAFYCFDSLVNVDEPWRLSRLIILAMVMAVLLVIENVSIKWLRPFMFILLTARLQLIAYASNHSYHSFENINFLEGPERRRTRRRAAREHRYQIADADDMVPLRPQGQQSPRGQDYQYTDPYAHDHDTPLYAEGGRWSRFRTQFLRITSYSEGSICSHGSYFFPYNSSPASSSTASDNRRNGGDEMRFGVSACEVPLWYFALNS